MILLTVFSRVRDGLFNLAINLSMSWRSYRTRLPILIEGKLPTLDHSYRVLTEREVYLDTLLISTYLSLTLSSMTIFPLKKKQIISRRSDSMSYFNAKDMYHQLFKLLSNKHTCLFETRRIIRP